MLDKLHEWLSQYGYLNPFAAVPRDLQRDALQAITTVAQALQSDVKRILDEMTAQFDVILKGSVQTAGTQQARRHLGKFFKQAMPEVEAMEKQLMDLKS